VTEGGELQEPSALSLFLGADRRRVGTNPYGMQIFAMRPDGSGLRPLPAARGFAVAPDAPPADPLAPIGKLRYRRISSRMPCASSRDRLPPGRGEHSL